VPTPRTPTPDDLAAGVLFFACAIAVIYVSLAL
jgi:hypothetical protein